MAIWRYSASPPPCEIKSNLIRFLKENCGEKMKSGTIPEIMVLPISATTIIR
jgi:hypothetical protein